MLYVTTIREGIAESCGVDIQMYTCNYTLLHAHAFSRRETSSGQLS